MKLFLGKRYGSPYYGTCMVVSRARKANKTCKSCGQKIEKGQLYYRRYSIDYFEHYVDFEEIFHLNGICCDLKKGVVVVNRKGNVIYPEGAKVEPSDNEMRTWVPLGF